MSVLDKKAPRAYLREARIKAGYKSMGDAGLALHQSPEVVGRVERGEQRVAPDDILAISEAYNNDSIILHHCNNECPIGRVLTGDVQKMPMAQATLRLRNALPGVERGIDTLANIMDDGLVNPWENQDFINVMLYINNVFGNRFRDALYNAVLCGYIKMSDIKNAAPASTGADAKINYSDHQYSTQSLEYQPDFAGCRNNR